MDFLKRQLADHKADFEVKVRFISLTLVPPPHQAVNAFLTVTREQKLNHQSKRYRVEPLGGNGGAIADAQGRIKIGFLDGEVMQTTNKYYASKSDNKLNWEVKNF
jgi:hypothetical protein